MISKIARYFPDSHVLRGSASALVIKFTASALGFVMFALCSRYMEPASFGTLAIIFNAISFLSVVALCGQETLIVRSWDEYRGTDRPSLARGALVFGVRVTLGAALVAAVVTGIVWSAWDRTVSLGLVAAACTFMFAHSLLQFTGQFSRVSAGVLVGETPRELLWRLFVVIAIAIYHLLHIDFGQTEFFATAAAAILAAILFQTWLVASSIPPAVRGARSDYDLGSWLPRSFRMWTSALMDTTSQYLEVVLIGFVLGPTAAGLYFVATRITNVFAMITGSISIYATSQISALFYSGAKPELQHMLRALAIISAVLNGAALLTIIVAGKLLLSIFGPAYVSAFPALVILAIGASAGALVGPATHLLLLTGHEGAYPRIMAPVLFIRAILIVALTPWLGLMGAAIAWSVSTLVMAVALIIACRRLVGLDPSLSFALRLPQPSTVGLK
jgi:O-antigen/teichoic acid export membrane protein